MSVELLIPVVICNENVELSAKISERFFWWVMAQVHYVHTFGVRQCYSDIRTLLHLTHIEIEGGVIDVSGSGVILSKYSIEVVVHMIVDHRSQYLHQA